MVDGKGSRDHSGERNDKASAKDSQSAPSLPELGAKIIASVEALEGLKKTNNSSGAEVHVSSKRYSYEARTCSGNLLGKMTIPSCTQIAYRPL